MRFGASGGGSMEERESGGAARRKGKGGGDGEKRGVQTVAMVVQGSGRLVRKRRVEGKIVFSIFLTNKSASLII